jgi:hypothetical protein
MYDAEFLIEAAELVLGNVLCLQKTIIVKCMFGVPSRGCFDVTDFFLFQQGRYGPLESLESDFKPASLPRPKAGLSRQRLLLLCST